LRLRSTVRSDEMKAESTLPPAQPTSIRGVPMGLVLSSVWLSSVQQPGRRSACGLSRQTVYETNSCSPVAPHRSAATAGPAGFQVEGVQSAAARYIA
jgi:hypothetical protein